MTIYRNFISALVVISSLLVINHAIAENGSLPADDDIPDVVINNAPKYYPENFEQIGILREFLPGRVLQISGLNYYYGINTPVHTMDTKFASIANLAIDSILGFSYTRDAEGRHYLTEVWVIPPTAQLSPYLDI